MFVGYFDLMDTVCMININDVLRGEDFLAEIPLRSPRKLFISIIKKNSLRIKVSKN